MECGRMEWQMWQQLMQIMKINHLFEWIGNMHVMQLSKWIPEVPARSAFGLWQVLLWRYMGFWQQWFNVTLFWHYTWQKYRFFGRGFWQWKFMAGRGFWQNNVFTARIPEVNLRGAAPPHRIHIGNIHVTHRRNWHQDCLIKCNCVAIAMQNLPISEGQYPSTCYDYNIRHTQINSLRS